LSEQWSFFANFGEECISETLQLLGEFLVKGRIFPSLSVNSLMLFGVNGKRNGLGDRHQVLADFIPNGLSGSVKVCIDEGCPSAN
jgi:hypothetical protein